MSTRSKEKLPRVTCPSRTLAKAVVVGDTDVRCALSTAMSAAASGSTGVTRLVHFTPARNLPHILDDGAVRPVVELRADRRAYFAATDLNRYDGYPDRTCCSIEYPNPYYLRVARSRPEARTYPDWVALLLSVDLLDRPGVLLSPRNAAAGTAVSASVSAFDALYAPAVGGSGGGTCQAE